MFANPSTAPPTLSTHIHNITAIEVTWNTTQPAGWNTSHLVYHFTYYTRERRLLPRLSKELPWGTVSIVVNVKESIHKVEHIFSIRSNLIYQGKTYEGLAANTSAEYGEMLLLDMFTNDFLTIIVHFTDKAYLQLQFGSVDHCITWTVCQHAIFINIVTLFHSLFSYRVTRPERLRSSSS